MEKSTKDYLFVGIQGLLFLLFAFIPDLDWWSLARPWTYLGLGLSILGAIIIFLALRDLGSSLTAYPSPKSGATLRTSGMYRFARHPIYTGIILLTLGWSVFNSDVLQTVVSLSLGLLFYFKSKYEERGLLQAYGAAYAKYQEEVGRFFSGW